MQQGRRASRCAMAAALEPVRAMKSPLLAPAATTDALRAGSTHSVRSISPACSAAEALACVCGPAPPTAASGAGDSAGKPCSHSCACECRCAWASEH